MTTEDDVHTIVKHLISDEIGVTQLSELAQVTPDVLPQTVKLSWIKRKQLLEAFAKCASGELLSIESG